MSKIIELFKPKKKQPKVMKRRKTRTVAITLNGLGTYSEWVQHQFNRNN